MGCLHGVLNVTEAPCSHREASHSDSGGAQPSPWLSPVSVALHAWGGTQLPHSVQGWAQGSPCALPFPEQLGIPGHHIREQRELYRRPGGRIALVRLTDRPGHRQPGRFKDWVSKSPLLTLQALGFTSRQNQPCRVPSPGSGDRPLMGTLPAAIGVSPPASPPHSPAEEPPGWERAGTDPTSPTASRPPPTAMHDG